ncbi:undecaprenyl-phosphate glucose phosphotransferase [Benzoatithermus flavus]|uniref:Undecaprenyl-phosphate glucose phosphotransferase n=1 Tax=Benzoatithermus flavus TaxID=3108223 RepID=A0ABU8XXI1_9PROT
MSATNPLDDISAPPSHHGHRPFRLSLESIALMLRLADLAVVVLSALAAWSLRGNAGPSPQLLGFGIACASLMTLDLFAAAGLYRPQELGRIRVQAVRVAGAWSIVSLLLWLLAAATGSMRSLPSGFLASWWLSALALLTGLHAAIGDGVSRSQRRGRLATRIALVGAGPQAGHLVREIRRGAPALRVVGIFDDRRTRIPDTVENCPVLGTLDDLAAWTRRGEVDLIIVALPHHAAARRLACLERLRVLPIDVRLSPDLPGLEFGIRGAAEIAGLPLVRVFDRPLGGVAWLVKAIEDRVLAALILLLTGPLMLALAVLVRLDSPGPVLYRQQRFGFDGRPIDVLKFRTMYVDRCDPADGDVISARRGDPRVTPFGRFLRRTSLDELPQFWNVLKGEMSIVGPRPHATAQSREYAALIDGYLARHRVKPGITGWAQVNGLRGEADTLARMQERVRYDLHYIENWSLLFDLRIILRTLLVGFSHPNAY